MGEDSDDIIENEDGYKLKMDGNKRIKAFFGNPEEYFDINISEEHLLDSEGKAYDVIDDPPYPPGYEIPLKAEPETMEDTFSHWEVEIEIKTKDGDTERIEVDPKEYFDDYESEWTTFKVPREKPSEFETHDLSGKIKDMIEKVIITPFFTKVAPDNIDYDYKDFFSVKRGGYGLEINDWDVSYVEEGEEIEFHFYAINIPDRFRIYYGEKKEFDSGWVSDEPDEYRDDKRYAGEPIKTHTADSRVEDSDFMNGGKITFEKKEDHDWVRVMVTNRDENTAWRYTLGAEPEMQFMLFAEYSDGELKEISEEELTETDESDKPEVEIKATSDDGGPEMPDFVLVAVGPEDYDLGVDDLNISLDKTWEAEVWDPDKEEMVNKEFNIRHNENFSWKNIDESEFSQLPDDIEDDVRAWEIEDIDLCGGKASFSVNTNNFNQEFAFEIKGDNAGEETVLDYAGEKAEESNYDLWYAKAIVKQESYGGRQFDNGSLGEIGVSGYPLVGSPDGWGIMQLDDYPRRDAERSERELAWNWQKNVKGGINVMEQKRREASNRLSWLDNSVPSDEQLSTYPPGMFGENYHRKDILAIQYYNGRGGISRTRVYNDDTGGYEQFGHIHELSDEEKDELTNNRRIGFDFDENYEWEFCPNQNDYVEHIIDRL